MRAQASPRSFSLYTVPKRKLVVETPLLNAEAEALRQETITRTKEQMTALRRSIIPSGVTA